MQLIEDAGFEVEILHELGSVGQFTNCETVDVALIVNGGAPFFQCLELENRCFVLVDECIHVIENGDLILQVERRNALL
ncbi:hypothetical protein P8452_76532 [Trifolium repens]|nr:hypothetical protein P8452_39187 [Trifolium repens]WJX95186.1 hypothetical protein P8452_76532 [Trifolium repens]